MKTKKIFEEIEKIKKEIEEIKDKLEMLETKIECEIDNIYEDFYPLMRKKEKKKEKK